jgi:hypothetical protein
MANTIMVDIKDLDDYIILDEESVKYDVTTYYCYINYGGEDYIFSFNKSYQYGIECRIVELIPAKQITKTVTKWVAK